MLPAFSLGPGRSATFGVAVEARHLVASLTASGATDFDPPAEPVPGAESRKLYRRRVLKGATIIKTLANCEIGCQIRDQHERGAGLKIAADTYISAAFLLYVPIDGVAYRAEVRWRHGDRVGVEFIGSGPKPPHHYG